jgi:TIR domain
VALAELPKRRLHERLLLAAAETQGDEPVGPVPSHSESELSGFVKTEGIDRMAVIGAFTECERRGWMDLIKVMGPWHWQVTYPGLETADRMRTEDSAAQAEVLAKRKHGSPATEPEVAPGSETSWDVFIAHASEDKETFANDLAKALDALVLTVWYDDFELVIGDSLRQRIDEGLAGSEFGIVILSPNFFAKDWPQVELDGLTAKEKNGVKVILPIWHEIDRDGVARMSPTLAGRVAGHSSDGVDNVAADIHRAIRRHRLRRQ